jgi:hypothetical protein
MGALTNTIAHLDSGVIKMDLQSAITALAERLAKLEAVSPRRRVFNQQEAAREVGMSVSKLRAEMRAGRIKGTLNGRTWQFTDAEIQRYVYGEDAA